MAEVNPWVLFESRYQNIIPEFDAFINSLERPFPVGLRENGLHCLPYNLKEKLVGQNNYKFHQPIPGLSYYEVEGPRKVWGGDLDHHLGLYFMQALSSTLSSIALEPKEGESIFDMCAAPGGKTTHIAELMNNTGALVACEPDINRRRVLKANLTRLGVSNTHVLAGKAQDLSLPAQSFDRILLDGPCSSEGTFRRDVISGNKRRKVNYLEYNQRFRSSLHREQSSLLHKAFELLKPGGTLVYSTCTYDPDENEGQVSGFLERFPHMELTSIEFPFSVNLSPGLLSFGEKNFHQDCIKCVRVYPHKVNSIGFFIAKFIKRA